MIKKKPKIADVRTNSLLYFSIDSSCNDGQQNQDETGIDCGGPCDACSTCHDGIQNQNETGIDCGGPCSACRKLARPI